MSREDWTIWSLVVLAMVCALVNLLTASGCSPRPTYQERLERLYPPEPPELVDTSEAQLP